MPTQPGIASIDPGGTMWKQSRARESDKRGNGKSPQKPSPCFVLSLVTECQERIWLPSALLSNWYLNTWLQSELQIASSAVRLEVKSRRVRQARILPRARTRPRHWKPESAARLHWMGMLRTMNVPVSSKDFWLFWQHVGPLSTGKIRVQNLVMPSLPPSQCPLPAAGDALARMKQFCSGSCAVGNMHTTVQKSLVLNTKGATRVTFKAANIRHFRRNCYPVQRNNPINQKMTESVPLENSHERGALANASLIWEIKSENLKMTVVKLALHSPVI